MKRYQNLSGDSGVTAYEIAPRTIVVQFRDGWKYEYTYESAGSAAILTMQELARSGRGLSAFIATRVHDAYARKFR